MALWIINSLLLLNKVNETTIKLTLLDIQANDYLADIFDDKDEQFESKPLEKSNSQNIPLNENKNNDYDDSNYNVKGNPPLEIPNNISTDINSWDEKAFSNSNQSINNSLQNNK